MPSSGGIWIIADRMFQVVIASRASRMKPVEVRQLMNLVAA